MNCSNSFRLTSFFVPTKSTNGQLGVLSILSILLMPMLLYSAASLAVSVILRWMGTVRMLSREKSPFVGLSAEQTSRPFQIVGSGAFAEVLPVEANRDADFQDAAVIQIGSLLHNGKRSVGRDDHGLACQQPLVNHIEYALLDKAGAASRPKSSSMRRSGRISVFV